MMLARFVLAPLGKFRIGLTGHICVVIRGVEEQKWLSKFEQALKWKICYQ